MTRMGEREIGAVSGRLPDKPGELACMHLILLLINYFNVGMNIFP